MMKGLKNKSVLVTGASSGIGQAIALRFAQEGANVAINYYSDREEALATKADIDAACQSITDCGVQSLVIQADVSQDEDVDRMFETTLEKLGGIDILINNAGILRDRSFARTSDLDWGKPNKEKDVIGSMGGSQCEKASSCFQILFTGFT